MRQPRQEYWPPPSCFEGYSKWRWHFQVVFWMHSFVNQQDSVATKKRSIRKTSHGANTLRSGLQVKLLKAVWFLSFSVKDKVLFFARWKCQWYFGGTILTSNGETNFVYFLWRDRKELFMLFLSTWKHPFSSNSNSCKFISVYCPFFISGYCIVPLKQCYNYQHSCIDMLKISDVLCFCCGWLLEILCRQTLVS